MKRLNVGCGEDYKEDWVNVDSRKNIKYDLRVDLNKFPWKLKSNEYGEVLISHVLEHLDNPIEVLREIVRVCKNDAVVRVFVPHATSYANFSDLQHKHNFTEHTFSDEHLKEYELDELKLVKKRFVYEHKWKKLIPRFLKIFLSGVFDDLYFEFRVVKREGGVKR